VDRHFAGYLPGIVVLSPKIGLISEPMDGRTSERDDHNGAAFLPRQIRHALAAIRIISFEIDYFVLPRDK